MQQHSGQHLLSAVLAALFDAPTLSVHFGEAAATVDIGAASLSPAQLRAAELHANELIWENRPLAVSYVENAAALGLRKASERAGELRIVEIAGLDRSACGGTHVRATGEIGCLLLRKLDKVRGALRIEFLCGRRALGRARADFDALSKIAQTFSAPLDDSPALAAAQLEALKSAEKERRRVEEELGALQGRALYDAASPDAQGLRRVVRRLPSGALEPLRAAAQSFCARPLAAFVGVVEEPPQLLLAASADSGIDAGRQLKAALAAAGGRGGGAARLAQGSAPSTEALERALALLLSPAAQSAP